MKNQYRKHLASKVTMETINASQEDTNITVTAHELAETKKVCGRGVLAYAIAPNRKERRKELKTEKYNASHDNYDTRTVINNRGNAGKRVFRKMAYFHLKLAGLRRKRTGL